MGVEDALSLARQEVLASLASLSPSMRFQVIPYNLVAEPLCVRGRVDLLPAEPAVIEATACLLADLQAGGGTNHRRALMRGLQLRPDILFLVTDAGDMSQADVDTVSRFNRGHTVIHTVELARHVVSREDNPLRRLAEANHGTYRRLRLPE
jgi:hypothetical protein